jgi:hypothetical protein
MNIPRGGIEKEIAKWLHEKGRQTYRQLYRKFGGQGFELRETLEAMEESGIISRSAFWQLSAGVRKFMDDHSEAERKASQVLVAPPYRPAPKPLVGYTARMTANLREPIRVGMSFISGAQSAEPSQMGNKQ